MELVHGVPITRFCDDNKLTPRERLALFVPVCQAIQHAHQKGIIHRDIKPSNVLVTMYDDKPVPKVIDFGVAKAIDQRLTEKTMFTQFGALVGTFEYMSPEQAEMNALGVDTRSDIYSLGVLLYELLTGTTPLERTRLRAAALDEMVRLIREEEPPRPSTQAQQLGRPAERRGRAQDRAGSSLSKLVRGELDWIVMKCLEKDRSRRYETASGLARDLERYLADEPVEACPPSSSYRLRKFARKYKKALVTAAAFAVLLVAGVGGEHLAGGAGHVGREVAKRRARGEPAATRRRGGETRGLGSKDRGRQTARRGSSHRVCVRDGAGPACLGREQCRPRPRIARRGTQGGGRQKPAWVRVVLPVPLVPSRRTDPRRPCRCGHERGVQPGRPAPGVGERGPDGEDLGQCDRQGAVRPQGPCRSVSRAWRSARTASAWRRRAMTRR